MMLNCKKEENVHSIENSVKVKLQFVAENQIIELLYLYDITFEKSKMNLVHNLCRPHERTISKAR